MGAGGNNFYASFLRSNRAYANRNFIAFTNLYFGYGLAWQLMRIGCCAAQRACQHSDEEELIHRCGSVGLDSTLK